jgi:acyl-CoA dehydrogenase
VSEQDLLAGTVRDMLSAHEPFVLTPERPWDAALWADLAAAGLTGVGLREDAGGSGGEFADAVVVVAALAQGAAAVPVAEQLLVAGPALISAGLHLPPIGDPLSFAVAGKVTARTDGRGWSLTGTAADVPWGGIAKHLALLVNGPEGPVLALVAAGELAASAANLAGEPRGSLVLDGVPCAGAVLTPGQAGGVRGRFALARAVQLSAALQQVLAWTVQYAGEREQFGRPLARFQAIQMDLAEMAGEVTAVAALVDAAVQALDLSEDPLQATAAAKVRAGAAVEVVARLSHQVHGAIGFTQEYRLHHLTRRLWSWRDEAGTELHWSGVLGASLLSSEDSFWAALTRVV